MKIWLIMIAVVAILAIAGIAVANAVDVDIVEVGDGQTCASGPVCGNSCSPDNYCSNPTCGARTGKSCGCK